MGEPERERERERESGERGSAAEHIIAARLGCLRGARLGTLVAFAREPSARTVARARAWVYISRYTHYCTKAEESEIPLEGASGSPIHTHTLAGTRQPKKESAKEKEKQAFAGPFCAATDSLIT